MKKEFVMIECSRCGSNNLNLLKGECNSCGVDKDNDNWARLRILEEVKENNLEQREVDGKIEFYNGEQFVGFGW